MPAATDDFPPQFPAIRVAVVGAGVAGLAAARALGAKGLAVRVFDKARGVGGRTSVRRRGDFTFDFGAQYFTVRDSRFAAFVSECRAAGAAAGWEGRIAVIEDGGLGAVSETPRFVGVPGMNALARRLADTVEVRLQTRVAPPQWRDGIWRLRAADGGELGEFDSLLVALPPIQAADLLAEASSLGSAARAVHLRPCWAVMAGFGEPVETPFDGAFVNTGPLGWVARNNSKPGRPPAEAWVLHASGAWSAEHLEADSEEAAAALLEAFLRLPGVRAAAPVHVEAHRWLYSLPDEPLQDGFLEDGEHKLLLCGDWCRGGRIEGAYLSGLAAAERLLDASRT